jgi:hypothetical protein
MPGNIVRKPGILYFIQQALTGGNAKLIEVIRGYFRYIGKFLFQVVFLRTDQGLGKREIAVIFRKIALVIGILSQECHKISCQQRIQIPFKVIQQISFEIIDVNGHFPYITASMLPI